MEVRAYDEKSAPIYCDFLSPKSKHSHCRLLDIRIRLAIMQHIPNLAKQLGKEFFTEKLISHCVGWLRDDISTIRQAAAENLKVTMLML